MSGDMSDFSMLELFRIETENQATVLSEGLLSLERDAKNPDTLEALMRGAHSIKGAARIINLDAAVRIAHQMEDCFVAAQNNQIDLSPANVDVLLNGVDWLSNISNQKESEIAQWLADREAAIDKLVAEMEAMMRSEKRNGDPAAENLGASSEHEDAITDDLQEQPDDHEVEKTHITDFSMLELFRVESENQTTVLSEGLLSLERDAHSPETLEALMRAAHSIKGAARIIGLNGAVQIAHTMEDCFVAAQSGHLLLEPTSVDILLQAVDMLSEISMLNENDINPWFQNHNAEISAMITGMAAILNGNCAEKTPPPITSQPPAVSKETDRPDTDDSNQQQVAADLDEPRERVLRLSSEHLDRMLALASEMQVEWQWLNPFADSTLQMKRRLNELEKMVIDIDTPVNGKVQGSSKEKLKSIRAKAEQCREILTTQQEKLELHTRSISTLTHRLYHQSVASRMRPFADGVPGFKRMVRDLARSLGKQVRLEISGLDTAVDRDILEKIESPLNHLIRNAIDHGLEMPEERLKMAKPEEGTIHLEAVHQSGMLRITVADDGRGLDLEALKQKVVQNGHATSDMVDRMTESELMSFLFLPKFTMKEKVTEISGRGVGLDIVASMIRDVRGTIHSSAKKNAGMRFELLLPTTLSVIRALLVEIAGEPYAFPLVHINKTLKCNAQDIERVEGRQFITIDDQKVGLISAREVLGKPVETVNDTCYSIVVIGPMESRYGLIVDELLGESDLVEKVLDPRLGKVKDISAAAVTTNGAPLLIFDVSDLLRSIAKMVDAGKLGRLHNSGKQSDRAGSKRVLIVDDSLTVREVERKLLLSRGYEVEVAVDGIDGMNTVRSAHFDLVISDVDMPRMDGIEFVSQLKIDHQLKNIPVIIVSYKESDEDRMRGLNAGADYYLTKSSFHDETLLETVEDLIGQAG